MKTTRRLFLQTTVASSGALLLGCASEGSSNALAEVGDAGGGAVDAGGGAEDAGLGDTLAGPDPDIGAPPDQGTPDAGGHVEDTVEVVEPPPIECDDPFAGGELLGALWWAGEGDPPMNTPFNVGLDGRLYSDLEVLAPDDLVTPVENFYIRTRYPDQIDPAAPWAITVHGLVDVPFSITMADLEPLIEPMGQYVLECSGNGGGAHFGLLSACEWSGVPFEKILDMIQVQPEATRVLLGGFDDHSAISTHSTPGCSWVFSFEDLLGAGAFLATHMNGEPLTEDHGAPVRLFVPNWYGCTCVKWLNEIELVDDSQPSTSQMKEFAQRTHQIGTPAMAMDYKPATMDQTAMPIRVEKWRVDGAITYRVWGIMWGGYETTDALAVRFGASGYGPVDMCPPHDSNSTWSLWWHQWTPEATGQYEIQCRIEDPAIITKRLDIGFYNRIVVVDEV